MTLIENGELLKLAIIQNMTQSNIDTNIATNELHIVQKCNKIKLLTVNNNEKAQLTWMDIGNFQADTQDWIEAIISILRTTNSPYSIIRASNLTKESWNIIARRLTRRMKGHPILISLNPYARDKCNEQQGNIKFSHIRTTSSMSKIIRTPEFEHAHYYIKALNNVFNIDSSENVEIQLGLTTHIVNTIDAYNTSNDSTVKITVSPSATMSISRETVLDFYRRAVGNSIPSIVSNMENAYSYYSSMRNSKILSFGDTETIKKYINLVRAWGRMLA